MKKKNNLFIRITGLILFLFSLPMAIMSYVLAIDYQLKSQDDVMLFLAQDFPTLLLMTLFLIVSLFLLLYEADTFRKKGEGGTYTAMTVGTILAALLTLYLRMPVGGMTYQHVVNIVLVPCVLWLISQITMLAFGDHIVRNIATAISIFSFVLPVAAATGGVYFAASAVAVLAVYLILFLNSRHALPAPVLIIAGLAASVYPFLMVGFRTEPIVLPESVAMDGMYFLRKFVARWNDSSILTMRRLELAAAEIGNESFLQTISYGRLGALVKWLMTVYHSAVFLGVTFFAFTALWGLRAEADQGSAEAKKQTLDLTERKASSKKNAAAPAVKPVPPAVPLTNGLLVPACFVIGGAVWTSITGASSYYTLPYYLMLLPMTGYGLYMLLTSDQLVDRLGSITGRKREEEAAAAAAAAEEVKPVTIDFSADEELIGTPDDAEEQSAPETQEAPAAHAAPAGKKSLRDIASMNTAELGETDEDAD